MKKVKRPPTPPKRRQEPQQKADASETKRFTIDLPVQLHRKLKVACASEGRKMRDVIIELLERELQGAGVREVETGT